ncbi:uncharacterized protein LOC142891713 isoform X3 [Nelusetta ayraudi]|uniref:uncharacterized protein LOC142891713 isoform X3 n=1 Tax=Nelusetta ayraudi TaxID=303726 RepID=UPI003F714E17
MANIENLPKFWTIQQVSNYRCRSVKRNTSCPATLFLILKRHPECGERKSRSGDPHMTEGLFLHISLRNEHNHHHGSCLKATMRRAVPTETVEKLKNLFKSGHTPSSALKLLKYNLQVSEQDAHSACPDLQFCYRLYYKLFRKAYNTTAGEETFKELEQTLDNYNKEQGDVCAAICKTPGNELVIAVCTPLMKRVHARLRESSETVFVESSENGGRKQHLFLLLAHSSVGALPLGVLITTSETQDALSAAMQLLLTVFPPERFHCHHEGPRVFMTNNCAAVRQVLRDVFPKAALLYSVHHLLQAMFRWLWTSSNEVPQQHRTHLLKSFRGLLGSPTPAALEESYIRLAEDHVASQHSKFLRRLEEVFTQRQEWAACLCAHLSAAHGRANEYMESATRFAKEKVLHRLKSYSLTQLVNFVVTRMEAHYMSRLTGAANSRLQVSPRKVVKIKDVERHSVLQEEEDSYIVESRSNAAAAPCHVNVVLGCCTCPTGMLGGHCKHQGAVARTVQQNDGVAFCLSPETRKLCYQIATGKEIPEKGRLPTAARKKTAQPDTTTTTTTTTQVCMREILCSPELSPPSGDPASDIWCEAPQSSPMHTPTSESVETHCGEGDLRERLKCVFQDITQKLDNPELSQSIASFVSAYENIGVDGEMAAALSSFGQSVRAEARGCKRQRAFQPAGVQLTAVLRSEGCLDGEGGVIIGRPSKASKQEHVYVTAMGNPSPEFHAIIQCVEESVCLEGNQLEIHTLPL